MTFIISFQTFQKHHVTCHFVLRIREDEDGFPKEPTIYWRDQASVSEVIVRLQVNAGESKEYVIALYDNDNTTTIIVVVIILTVAIIGVIIGIWKVIMKVNHLTQKRSMILF